MKGFGGIVCISAGGKKTKPGLGNLKSMAIKRRGED
jgi:hypothetical protein